MKRFIAFAFVFVLVFAPLSAEGIHIPEAFWGKWAVVPDSDINYIPLPDGYESLLEISADSIYLDGGMMVSPELATRIEFTEDFSEDSYELSVPRFKDGCSLAFYGDTGNIIFTVTDGGLTMSLEFTKVEVD